MLDDNKYMQFSAANPFETDFFFRHSVQIINSEYAFGATAARGIK